ncbi:Uncharacterised protein [Vibrio cholerae]|nr:Uncharacterised protein [Vibrio cholerae]
MCKSVSLRHRQSVCVIYLSSKLALRFLGLVVLVFPISTSLIVKQIALTTFLATMLCSSIAWSMNEV